MAKFKDYDDYIDQAQEFARPMLTFIRACVNEACPEAKEEFKWSFPNFTYNGSILCYMAGFKNHITLGFWLGTQMEDPENLMNKTGNTGMGDFGKLSRIESLPEKEVLIAYIKDAMRLMDAGVKPKSSTGTKKKAEAIEVPKSLVNALNNNEVAFQTFNAFSQSNRNDYSEWINEAKTEKTETKRLAQALEWLEEGKPKNWKYMKEWK